MDVKSLAGKVRALQVVFVELHGFVSWLDLNDLNRLKQDLNRHQT